MPRPEFSQPGTQQGGQTVATNERPELIDVTKTPSTTVAAGSTETTEIYAPTDGMYRVVSMKLRAPAISDATTDQQELHVRMKNHTLIRALAGTTATLSFKHGVWFYADTQFPPGDQATIDMMQALKATDSDPIRVDYKNPTDADQTGTRTISFVCEEVSY